jgi:geranylgeranyl diphosphate synthase type I
MHGAIEASRFGEKLPVDTSGLATLALRGNSRAHRADPTPTWNAARLQRKLKVRVDTRQSGVSSVDDTIGQPYARAHRMTRIRTSLEGQAPSRSSSGWSIDFCAFADEIRELVDRALVPWLDRRVAEAERRGKDVHAVADAMRQLVLRGGKRMRPVLLAAAFEACGGEGGPSTVLPAAVAMELLQAYLLTHDDWMDGDEIRRGGPSVPAMMRDRFAGMKADAMSILAGDLAAAWARLALLEVAVAPERVLRAATELARVEEDVVEGQILDVGGNAASAEQVETMHALKTASYSVRGPVVVGAHLAGAPPSQIAALSAFAMPLGVAFQLRDDLLGVFGDPAVTGKPAGSDIRCGKRSAVLIEAMDEVKRKNPLALAFGRADATDEHVRAAVASLETIGVRSRVEARIAVLAESARGALERAELAPRGHALLGEAALAFTCGTR